MIWCKQMDSKLGIRRVSLKCRIYPNLHKRFAFDLLFWFELVTGLHPTALRSNLAMHSEITSGRIVVLWMPGIELGWLNARQMPTYRAITLAPHFIS